MVEIPREAMELLNNDRATKVVATKTPEGDVHAIIVGSISAPDPRTIVFGTLIMHRTSENLKAMREKGELAAVLVAYKAVSYEIRCRVLEQRFEDKELDRMNKLLELMGLEMSSVWYLEPMEVRDQSASPEAGTRLV
jgi:hypothetical protein